MPTLRGYKCENKIALRPKNFNQKIIKNIVFEIGKINGKFITLTGSS